MAADSQGNDLSAVGVPIGGLVAFASYAAENVIEDTKMGDSPITLPAGYEMLGLVKQDGAPQHQREDGEALEFWQAGYKQSASGTRSVQVNLAENNAAVLKLTEGKVPDENGIIYVDSSLPSARVLLFMATKFKGGSEDRYNGAAQVTAVEVDQDTRGEVRGRSVTLSWSEDPLFNGAPFKMWHGEPGASKPVTPTGVTAGEPGSFAPACATVPATITALRALGDLGQTTAWTTGQYVAIGSGNVHWDGADWAMGIAS